MRKVAISGRIYSDNIGDAMILRCSESLVLSEEGDIDLVRIDLGGNPPDNRSKMRHARKPSLLLKFHRVLYSNSIVYGSIFSHLLFLAQYPRLRRDWAKKLQGVELLFIGGGQLIQHSRYFFPLRLMLLTRLASASDTRVVFWGVGVGKKWTYLMRRYFLSVLGSNHVHRIVTRDVESTIRLKQHISEIETKLVTGYDLAVVSSCYVTTPKTPRETIGIAPISPYALKRVNVNSSLADKYLAVEFWRELAQQIIDAGYEVSIFTTGTKEDYIFSAKVVKQLEVQEGGGIKLNIKVPDSPESLCEIINDHAAVIGGRLHCSILCWSYGIPFKGAYWDSKVKGFAQSVGAEKYFFSPDSSGKDVFADLVSQISALPHKNRAQNANDLNDVLKTILRELKR